MGWCFFQLLHTTQKSSKLRRRRSQVSARDPRALGQLSTSLWGKEPKPRKPKILLLSFLAFITSTSCKTWAGVDSQGDKNPKVQSKSFFKKRCLRCLYSSGWTVLVFFFFLRLTQCFLMHRKLNLEISAIVKRGFFSPRAPGGWSRSLGDASDNFNLCLVPKY